jgi:NAD(P)-dependent dehydrogenase (short-subunit alcohol dehydrogenase family)
MKTVKTVVVTGTSTGIGYSAAQVLTKQGFRVFGSVRQAADGERLRRELGQLFEPLLFDVSDDAAVTRAAEMVAARLDGRTLFGLVNNAGVAFPGPLLYLPIDDFRRQLDVNLTAQLFVTQTFAPLLGADETRQGDPGRIVMMSSIGGRTAAPFVGAYSASKFGLEGMSECLRRELMVFGIDVIVIAPGAVVTPIWNKAESLDVGRFAHTRYGSSLEMVKRLTIENGRRGLPADVIGRAVLTALTATRPKTRYTITPEPIKFLLGRILPKRLVDRLIAKRLGLVSARAK